MSQIDLICLKTATVWSPILSVVNIPENGLKGGSNIPFIKGSEKGESQIIGEWEMLQLIMGDVRNWICLNEAVKIFKVCQVVSKLCKHLSSGFFEAW